MKDSETESVKEREIEREKWKKEKKLEKKLAANYLEGLHRETRNQGWSVT